MKYFIIGATGYIGCNLFKVASSLGPTIGTSTKGGQGFLNLNLENIDCKSFNCIGPDTNLIIAAAVSAPDICRNQPTYAQSVNVTGSCDIIDYALSRGAKVLFLSSDTVYGEQKEPFDESQPVNPIGQYAEMKHQVEFRFRSYDSFKSIRLSYVFSQSDKFYKYLENIYATNSVADVYHPFYRSLIHRDDVTDGVFALLQNWANISAPNINFGGPSCVSRIDMVAHLSKIKPLIGLQYRSVIPDSDFFSDRPKIINMLSPLLENILGRKPKSFIESAN